MLESVSIKSFKSLKDVQILLEPITILAGPNGSGKTSVLEVLEILSATVRADPKTVFWGPRSPAILHTHGAAHNIELEANFSSQGRTGTWAVRVLDAPADSKENVRWTFERGENRKNSTDSDEGNQPLVGKKQAYRAVSQAQYLRFELERLIAPSFGEFPNDELRTDGSNLPSLLATISATKPEQFETIQEQMRSVVPTIKRVRLEQEKRTVEYDLYDGPDSDSYRKATKEERGFKLLFQLRSGAVVPASSVSEGVILTLALFAFLHSPKRPHLVLIDNLERGLHPRALKELVHRLREVQRQEPRLQIVATTHSPYLLDLFEASEIRLMYLNDEGHTICQPIQSHSEFQRWKDEMLPGEFWSMVGEKWLLDKAATAGSQQP